MCQFFHFPKDEKQHKGNRRQYLSLVQMYKIIFGYCDINCHHYFDIIGITRTRSKHEYKIRPKVARTNYFKYSFLIDILTIGTVCLLK